MQWTSFRFLTAALSRATVFLICTIVCGSHVVRADDAIIELSVGGAAAIGIKFDELYLSTPSIQTSPVQFELFLDGLADIGAPGGTFTLSGLQKSGPAAVLGTLMIQQFTGGTFSLYHPDTSLLLSGQLSTSALAGPLGQPDGTLFTSSYSTVTGGSLADELVTNSLVLQMHMWNVNDGAGYSVNPTGPGSGMLNTFTADVTVEIEAVQVPEPASLMLLVAAALPVFVSRRFWRRG